MTSESALSALRETSEKIVRDFVDRPVVFRGYLSQVLSPVLTDILGAVKEQILKDFHRPEATTSITHYTSLATLLSLIEGSPKTVKANSLRLSPTYRFNDPTEGSYLPREIAGVTDHDWLEAEVAPLAFAACFVSNGNENAGDDLVYWRSYGGDGEGCSITWNPEGLPNLYAVAYSEGVERVTKGLEPILAALQPVLHAPDPISSREARRVFGQTFWRSLTELRYLHKSDAYRHERESRVLITEGSESFQPDRVVFVREDEPGSHPDLRRYYVDPSLSAERIFRPGTRITLGPRVRHAPDAKAYIEDRLKTPLVAEVRMSSVPYRTT